MLKLVEQIDSFFMLDSFTDSYIFKTRVEHAEFDRSVGGSAVGGVCNFANAFRRSQTSPSKSAFGLSEQTSGIIRHLASDPRLWTNREPLFNGSFH